MTKSSETRFKQAKAFIVGYHAGWNAERSGPGPGRLFEDWFRGPGPGKLFEEWFHASRCFWKLSLDDLSAQRAAMDVGLLRECCKDQPEDHPCRMVWSDETDRPAFSLVVDEGRVAKATVKGLVAEHNAIPVLIEVARAALRLRAAEHAASQVRIGMPWVVSDRIPDRSAEVSASREVGAAAEAYDAALARVTCRAAPPKNPPTSCPASPTARPEHNDGTRSECPGYERSRAISIARDQLARMTGPVNVEANRLARLLLNALGEEP